MIRRARKTDIPRLLAIESVSFTTDRLTGRAFRGLLDRGKASLMVDAEGDQIRGYGLTLYRGNSRRARLYSLAVDPSARGKGIARELITAAEAEAVRRGKTRMRLEVHPENKGARALYADLGYREFAVVADFYGDHSSAIRLEKRLVSTLETEQDA